MNVTSKDSISIISLIRKISFHWALLISLSRREVVGRYRGSVIGLMWSFFNPVLLLTVYTFVFGVVFKTRWGGESGSKAEFALILFAGLIFFNLFSECINRAPGLILGNPNFVKKVVFPLELLPIVSLLSAVFHAAISMLVWLLFCFIFLGLPPVTILMLPLIFVPLVLYVLGLSWFLSALSVYVRDISQMVGLLITVLMFMSPIFYSISTLPPDYQVVMHFNPLTFVVEQSRDLMIFGRPMRWGYLAVQMVASFGVAYAGYAWFQKTRKGFADVL